MRLTRQYFRWLAEILGECDAPDAVVEAFVRECKRYNERFDEERFWKAVREPSLKRARTAGRAAYERGKPCDPPMWAEMDADLCDAWSDGWMAAWGSDPLVTQD